MARFRVLLLLVLLAPPVGAGQAQAEDDSKAGHAKAKQWCARCHVIGEDNPMGGINSTPSFFIMARKPQTYSAKLLTFQERPPHAALTFDLTNQDVRNILAYVKTLPTDR